MLFIAPYPVASHRKRFLHLDTFGDFLAWSLLELRMNRKNIGCCTLLVLRFLEQSLSLLLRGCPSASFFPITCTGLLSCALHSLIYQASSSWAGLLLPLDSSLTTAGLQLSRGFLTGSLLLACLPDGSTQYEDVENLFLRGHSRRRKSNSLNKIKKVYAANINFEVRCLELYDVRRGYSLLKSLRWIVSSRARRGR
ncbi:hypothetical protein BDY19DRAFT_953649 [Irpex rosettiformis]|uniref:Uncharacterized protein n=1 Tax=Irpex rosettiformis TaxID=378272 RepID=A0ACB8U0K7_9APHY|nr:hypothetical protein BDY19DRAFT_953649 [Irpex rosettiformis]